MGLTTEAQTTITIQTTEVEVITTTTIAIPETITETIITWETPMTAATTITTTSTTILDKIMDNKETTEAAEVACATETTTTCKEATILVVVSGILEMAPVREMAPTTRWADGMVEDEEIIGRNRAEITTAFDVPTISGGAAAASEVGVWIAGKEKEMDTGTEVMIGIAAEIEAEEEIIEVEKGTTKIRSKVNVDRQGVPMTTENLAETEVS